MRLLANENFPGRAAEALRSRGHGVIWVRTDLPGTSDRQVVAHAIAESRLLLTFDKDFGELTFRLGVPASCGIVQFRVALASPEPVARTAVAVLESRGDWAGHFSVIEETRVRMVPLPRP